MSYHKSKCILTTLRIETNSKKFLWHFINQAKSYQPLPDYLKEIMLNEHKMHFLWRQPKKFLRSYMNTCCHVVTV